MKHVANAQFTIKSWDEKPYSEGPDLPKLIRADRVTHSRTHPEPTTICSAAASTGVQPRPLRKRWSPPAACAEVGVGKKHLQPQLSGANER
jgi:hypothetical protein